MTGPNISSRAIFISSVTSANIVGSTKCLLAPGAGHSPPPLAARAPCDLPLSRYPVTRSSCACETSGPSLCEGIEWIADPKLSGKCGESLDKLR